MAQIAQMAASAVSTAKQELRRKLRSALTAMTEKQRQEESDVLAKKVRHLNPHLQSGILQKCELAVFSSCTVKGLFLDNLMFHFLALQFLATEEYQSSKRISVYLSMPTEVDTEKILEARNPACLQHFR